MVAALGHPSLARSPGARRRSLDDGDALLARLAEGSTFPVATLTEAAEAFLLGGNAQRAEAIALEAVAAADAADDVAGGSDALLVAGYATSLVSDADEGLAMMERAIGRDPRADDPLRRERAWWYRACAGADAARWDDALVWFDRLAGDALGPERSPRGAHVDCYRAELSFRLGRPTDTAGLDALIGAGRSDEARAHLAELIADNALVDREAAVWVLTRAATLAVWEGAVDDCRAAVAAALGDARHVDNGIALCTLAAVGARCEADAASDARQRRDRPIEARIVARAREHLEVADQRMRHPGPVGGWSSEGRALVALCAAEVARAAGGGTVGEWTAVAAAWDSSSAPHHAAYARVRAAEAALAVGDHAAASRLLDDARAVAVDLGAEPLQRLAERIAAGAP